MSTHKVDPATVDRSRAGHLVHDASSSGRDLTVVAYIEGLSGDRERYAIESRITYRTQEQAAEIARAASGDNARTDEQGDVMIVIDGVPMYDGTDDNHESDEEIAEASGFDLDDWSVGGGAIARRDSSKET